MIKSKIRNIAIIMDGNGRWAQERGRPRVWGHIRGSSRVSAIVEMARSRGLESLTLYAFSTENWSRPEHEVNTLFRLFVKFIHREAERIVSNQIRFQLVGERDNLPSDLLRMVEDLENKTSQFSAMKLNLAFNYGGRREILHAVNKWIKQHPSQLMSDEKSISSGTYCPEVGEIDLMIRTGGDQRISNFLIWQAAYAELFFTPIAWPEFLPSHLEEILSLVETRERRFGMVAASDSLDHAQRFAKEHAKSFVQGQSSGVR